MRSILIASLALTATLTSAFAPSIADACGGYMPDPTPAVFAIDEHRMRVPGTYQWQRRAFVALRNVTAGADVTWTRLSPQSYVATQIALQKELPRSTTFTLVGPSGSRVVSTNRSALLSQTFRNPKAHEALEVSVDEGSHYRVAVVGT
ncbi:MAG: hypothetical protein H0T42_02070, partial [Deltaproteobacteria bacterium]|nr:hypothetical protein [Deltaproteobacteria bacterium]